MNEFEFSQWTAKLGDKDATRYSAQCKMTGCKSLDKYTESFSPKYRDIWVGNHRKNNHIEDAPVNGFL